MKLIFFPVCPVLYLIIVSENINSGEAKGETKEEAKGKQEKWQSHYYLKQILFWQGKTTSSLSVLTIN